MGKAHQACARCIRPSIVYQTVGDPTLWFVRTRPKSDTRDDDVAEERLPMTVPEVVECETELHRESLG